MNVPYSELFNVSVNTHYFRRYVKFMESYRSSAAIGIVENHHILPRSYFPEYEDNKWNMVALPLRAHYLAHYMLAKAIGGKMWFAFNMMSRAKENIKYNSYLYESTRRYLAQEMSRVNSGREMSDDMRAEISKRFKDTVNVRDKDGNTFNVSRNDERYLSGKLQHVCVGRKHSDDTRRKMSDNSNKGKTAYTHRALNIVKYFDDDPGGCWEQGNLYARVEKEYLDGTIWITRSGRNMRVPSDELLPGDVVGRREFDNNGLIKMNSRVKVFDLCEWKYKRVEELQPHYIKHGVRADEVILYCYKNCLFSSYDKYREFCYEEKIYAPKKGFEGTDIIKPHHNMRYSSNLDGTTNLGELGYHTITKTEHTNGEFDFEKYIIQ